MSVGQYGIYPAAGTGTAISVGLADGSTVPIYAITNTPVTTTGTLTFTLSTQAANKVFAGPTTGAAAQPTFRSLVSADLPSLAYANQSLSNLSATAINTDLLPAADVTQSLGDSAHRFSNAFIDLIKDNLGSKTLDVTNHSIYDGDGVQGLSLTGHNATFGIHPAGNGARVIRIYDDSDSTYVSLKAPTAVTTYNLILPAAQGGANTFLKNDGAGNLTWASAGSGSVTDVTASSPLASSGGATPNITIQTASASLAGALSAADWTTFNNKQAALTIGNLTDAGTDGITVTGGTGAVIGSGTSIAQHVADTTHNGYLSSTDWNTFNGKQATGNYITALTGDVTASGPGSVAATLATVNSNVGSFGSSTSIPSLTVNAKGLVTAASGNAVVAPAGTLTGTTLASNVVTSSLTSLGTQAASLDMGGNAVNNVASLTGTQIATPSNPAASHDKLYFKSDDNLYSLDSSGNERQISAGMVGTDWAAYTPTITGCGTVSGVNIYYRRIGGSLEVYGYFTTGTVTASAISISFPSSLNIDTGKVGAGTNLQAWGDLRRETSSSQVYASDITGPYPMFYDGSTTNALFVAGGTSSNNMTKANGSSLFSSGDVETFSFAVPISGWSANNGPGRSGFQFYASSKVTTNSSDITSASFATFSNSPAFTFTPTFTGTYKVSTAANLRVTASGTAVTKVFNTTGGATLLFESQAFLANPSTIATIESTISFQSVYTLTAGVSYVFDIQGKPDGSHAVSLDGSSASFYMFAELCG